MNKLYKNNLENINHTYITYNSGNKKKNKINSIVIASTVWTSNNDLNNA